MEQQVNASYEDKLLEQALEIHKSIYEHLSSGLIRIDDSGIITFTNRAAAKILGWSDKALVGKPAEVFLFDVNHYADLKNDVNFNHKFAFKKKDGGELDISFYSNEMDGQGTIVIFHEVSNNTENYNHNRIERMATLGELSIGIAHELRNPLAGIKLTAQVMQEYIQKQESVPTFELQEFLKRLVVGVDRADSILQGFFKFAQPSKAKPDFVDIEMLISGVYLSLAPLMNEQKVEFETDFSHFVPQIYADIIQIEQALFNVFLNAIEAMTKSDAGLIKVVPQIEMRSIIMEDNSEKTIKMICIKVYDSGEGIQPKSLQKIFNPFFTTKQEHVGMGLSVATRLLEENNGWIEVAENEHKGSVFTLLIPSI